MPDAIDEFVRTLQALDPGVSASVDHPDDPKGEVFIDLSAPGFSVAVSFKTGVGFGFFDAERSYGQRPTHLVVAADRAARRAADMHRRMVAEARQSNRDLRMKTSRS